MLVLGVETSGLDGSIALLRDQTCLGELRLNQPGRRHAQSLVLEIGELLRANGCVSGDVDIVAVSRGPGSFTGLRVGMVCAKTFAYATGCRFIAVDTFAAIAENVSKEVARVYVIEDAQRDDLFVGEYERNESGEWRQKSPIQIVSVVAFLQDRTDSDIVTGTGLKKLDSTSIPANWLSESTYCQPKASVVALLGQQFTVPRSGDLPSNDTNFWKASPFYLRLSAAEEKRAADDVQVTPK